MSYPEKQPVYSTAPADWASEAVCISHSANNFGKCIHPTILPRDWTDWALKFWYSNWYKRRKNLNSNLLKKIDFAPHPLYVEEVGKYILFTRSFMGKNRCIPAFPKDISAT